MILLEVSIEQSRARALIQTCPPPAAQLHHSDHSRREGSQVRRPFEHWYCPTVDALS